METIKDIALWILVVINVGIVFWFYNAASQYIMKHQRTMTEIEDDYKKAYQELKDAEYKASKEYIETLKQFVAECKLYREAHPINESRRDTTADIQSGEVEN